MLMCLLFVSPLWAMGDGHGQGVFPTVEGERVRYHAYIEMPRATVSGIAVLMREGGVVRGSLFNEFGLTALDFTYDLQRRRVTLHHVVAMMDKWYVRRVIRRDMARLMRCLEQGETQYRNEGRRINYQFLPMAHEVTE